MHSAICGTGCRCIVNWGAVYLSSVYVHSAICDNLFGVIGISEIYCQLEFGGG